MLTEARQLKIGNIIEVNNVIYKITQMTQVKPGKGGAFKQIVAQGIFENKKLETRFRVEEMVEKLHITEKNLVCVAIDKSTSTFIDLEESEDININNNIINHFEFLEEGYECTLLVDEDNNMLEVKLPKEVNRKINTTPIGTGAGEKNATLDNGVMIKVPQYIKEGEIVVISLVHEKPIFKSRT